MEDGTSATSLAIGAVKGTVSAVMVTKVIRLMLSKRTPKLVL